MKIKCPACATVLNVPDTAAGKVVKCPCGKQLRAPGGAAKPAAQANPFAAAPNRPASNQPATGTRAAGAPTATTPRRGAAAPNEFDPGMFDELTESDLQPVRAVAQPGRPSAVAGTSAAGSKLLQQYGSSSDRKGDLLLGPRSNRPIAGIGQRIGGALVDGFFNMLGMVLGVGLMFGYYAASGTEPSEGFDFSDPAFWMLMIGAAIPYIVNAVLVSMSGQTVGKKAVGTVIVNESTGAPVGFTQGILQRNFVFGMITGIPIVGPFIALADIVYLFMEDHQTLHDKLAKTLVVEA